MTGKSLIETNRVEGTNIYDAQGNKIGSVKRLMIEKLSGRVPYAVGSFGGFLGIGAAVPWNKLTYNTSLGGYRTEITEQQLRGAPAFSRHQTYDWTDLNRERELHDHYDAPYYWEDQSVRRPLKLQRSAHTCSDMIAPREVCAPGSRPPFLVVGRCTDSDRFNIQG